MAAARLCGQMNSDEHTDEQVIDAWSENASPWTNAVRNRTIESRNLVTDNAIIDAVMSCNPQTVLDLGCGEGWLCRTLSDRGMTCIGVDAIPALIDNARKRGGGEFRTASYEEIAANGLDAAVDAVVANFSLIGRDAVDGVIRRIPSLLNPSGSFVMQTLHPVTATEGLPYADGWLEGTWESCGTAFSPKAAPWYCRTLGTWIKTLIAGGLLLKELREPIDPRTSRPASLILIAGI
jgi:2-polyprenyl-3-methyl-5-hydroxy-6-metoxy-1,4-benzoquinol methylase